jgi:anti-anti-sigma factor
MEITVSEQSNITIVALQGNLDATTADEVSQRISTETGQDAVSKATRANLIIDLSGIQFMSSAGLRAILAAAQDARNAGGDLRLAGGEPNIKRVLDFSGFTKIMKYYDSVGDALASFGV